MTRWRYAAATDTGLVRDSNQDAVFVDDSLALVADGMGGHAAGDVASEIATEVVRDAFHRDSTVAGLHHAIEDANRRILQDAREHPERRGMGTTVIAVGLTRDSADVVSPTLFNVGDSRAYQLRDGAMRQLSEDHSVAEEWVRMGRLTPEEAANHPRRHQLTRCLGVEGDIEIDVASIDATPGDRILICSDGLSNELSVEVLAHLASSSEPLEAIVDELVEAARNAGGRDNISAVLLEFDEVNVAAVPIKTTVSAKAPPDARTSRSVQSRRTRRAPRMTWRVWIGVALIAAVLGGGLAVVHWYAYSGYYLGEDAGMIAIYQGQPNGVLWYKPVLALPTDLSTRYLLQTDRQALAATISEPSLDAALNYARFLYSQRVPASTTTTTTTTIAKSKA